MQPVSWRGVPLRWRESWWSEAAWVPLSSVCGVRGCDCFGFLILSPCALLPRLQGGTGCLRSESTWEVITDLLLHRIHWPEEDPSGGTNTRIPVLCRISEGWCSTNELISFWVDLINTTNSHYLLKNILTQVTALFITGSVSQNNAFCFLI